MPLVYVNGQHVDASEATISVFDHGLVVGDGVFETVLVHGGRPFALGRHLERLARSAKGLGIAAPPASELVEAVTAVVESSGLGEARLRITVTAGIGVLGSARATGAPGVVVAVDELGEPHDHAGVAVVPWPRNEHGALSGLKTTSYAENALALAYAAERGADEAIFGNTAGNLCEGTGSNVFFVRDGRLLTTPLAAGCLAGITRALVLEHHGGESEDLPFAAFAAGEVEEAFLTSTLRGVQPISTIDGHSLAFPGQLTKQAADRYLALLEGDPEP